LSTNIYTMFTDLAEKTQKNKQYICEHCKFITRNKKDFNRHISTPKHIKNLDFDNKMTKIINIPTENPKKYNCECGKIYESRQGLHSHKKKCKIDKEILLNYNESFDTNNQKTDMYELMKILIKENSELKTMMVEQQNMVLEIVKNGTHNTIHNNNCNNKSFNLQVFLNETCKDAMNIMEFVDSIKLQLTDLESVGQLGYVKGISNIIVKNLKALDVTKRPVHCSDVKREVLYIKDNNKWEKEDPENNKLSKAIKYISHKNILLLSKWREKYPESQLSDSPQSDKYHHMVMEAMGGEGSSDIEKMNKIIRNIAKEVIIEK
jgi:hypothetical protein